MTNTHIVVFNAPISKARAARIKKVITPIEPSAYVVCGTEQHHQPGYVTVPGVVTDSKRKALYDAAMLTK
jgi:hypothetical protein